MPTEVDTLSGVPCSFEQGTTLRFTDSDPDYPSDAWTMAFVLNNGVAAAVSIAATVGDNNGFEVVIPASQAFTPGAYQWAEYFTAISPTTEKARGKTGTLTITANLATTATPSTAQAMVTLLQTALAALAATTKLTVNFAGQSFTRASIKDYQSQLVYWQAQLIAEQRAASAQRCGSGAGLIAPSFIAPQRFGLPVTDRCCQ